jgi:hypothetical protein
VHEPEVIVCADWSVYPGRGEAYRARVSRRGITRLLRPAGGWTLLRLLQAARAESDGGSVLVGIGVPLGVPASLAAALGPAAGANFLDLLRRAGSIPGFFDTSPEPAHWSPRQPFFDVDGGEEGLRRWTRKMQRQGVSAYRAIDLATTAKSPLVVSGVPDAMGATARAVWRTLLADVQRIGARVWPFDGSLAALTAPRGVVLGEVHPRAAYAIAKTDEHGRARAIAHMQQADWVRDHGIALGGLEAARRSGDAFDALFSAAVLLRCVFEGTPLDSTRTHPMEGGILGTASLNLEVREGSLPCAFVAQPHDATRIRRGRLQPEGGVDAFGQQALPATQRDRIQQEMKVVHEIVLEQGVHELVAAVREDVLAGRGLELPDLVHHVVANDGGVPPDRLLERPGDDVFRRGIHHVAEGVARLHRLERVRMEDVGLPSEEERVGVLHEGTEGGADVVVPVRPRPPAVLEPAFGVFVGTAGRLDDTVQ